MGQEQSAPTREECDVWITYCGDGGYNPSYTRFKGALEQAIPGIVVGGAPTPKASGAFEVEGLKSKTLHHSKLATKKFPDESTEMKAAVIETVRKDFEASKRVEIDDWAGQGER